MTLASSVCPASATIGSLLEELTREYGTSPLIYDERGPTSFAEIDARAARIAAGLLACGVAKGARVGILLPNDRNYPAALFGVMRIGGVAVLLSTLARAPELAYMIRTADIDTLLMIDTFLGNDYVMRLEEALPSVAGLGSGSRLLLPETPFLRTIWVLSDRQPSWSCGGEAALGAAADGLAIDEHFMRAAQAEVVPADPAVIIYTSGSAADPKAVVHSQGNLVRQALALAELSDFRPGDRALCVAPFFWVGGLTAALLTAMCGGASVVCPAGSTTEKLLAALEFVPTHMMLWQQHVDLLRDQPEFIRAFAKMRPAVAAQQGQFGVVPGELAPNSLGMTETLGPHSACAMGPLPASRKGSFGMAVGGIERRIIDDATGEERPVGEAGTLSLRGGTLMLGMHRKERADVFDADGYYRTDDLCSLSDDGHLFFIARANDMVKISGANVAPAEVERAIMHEPAIKTACIVGLSDGDGTDTLVAAIVVEEGGDVAPDGITHRLKTKLASYKIPRRYVFLSESELPMTASGKIHKQQLRTLLAEKLDFELT